jgi:tetratricopeptide (TPR) repeat protein
MAETPQTLVKAINLEPETGRIWLMRGTCSLKLGEYGPAREELGKAATLLPETEDAQRLLRYLDSREAEKGD